MSLLNPVAGSRAIWNITSILYRYRELTWEMTKREFSERYAGQALGVIWGIAHPLIIVLVYVFVFVFVFGNGTRRADIEFSSDFVVYILAGLMPWMAFQEVLAKGTQAIVGNSNLVKQVIFPVEVLPAKGVLSSLLTELVLLTGLMGYMLLRFHTLPWTVLLLPVLIFFQAVAMLGAALFLSALGAYFRDLKDVVQVFSLINVYLMPVVYLPAWVPEPVRPMIGLNPFSYMTWCFQDVFYNGHVAHPSAWFIFPVLSLVSLAMGYLVFNKLKPYLGNVL
jgi:lipopolysaccharide transport system permease protein